MKYSLIQLKQDRERLYKIATGVILVIFIFLSLYFYRQAEIYRYQVENPQQVTDEVAAQEVERILNLLRKHILLPQEVPTIYIISNPEEAKSAYGDFFNNTQNGDHLVLFQGKAIIYRESEDIIVNVGPIAFNSEPQE